MEPRVVLVSRQTEYQGMLETYGSASNSSYVVASAAMTAEAVQTPNTELAGAVWDGGSKLTYASGKRGLTRARPTRAVREGASNRATVAKQRHDQYENAINQIAARIPQDWRQARITRDLLDRFLFEPDDIVVVVGQDGLVANVSKYVGQQPVVGFNHAPDLYPGNLCQWNPVSNEITTALRMAAARHDIQQRTMVTATLDNGQSLTCLNEIFIGHRSHQSARYKVWAHGQEENQSSSGVIVCTGTGSTGWASSLYPGILWRFDKDVKPSLPGPDKDYLAYFVREPWSSPGTGTSIVAGNLAFRSDALGGSDRLVLTSQMEHGGVIFGDGIEGDFMAFDYGRVVHVGVAEQKLNLVVKQ